MENNLLRGNEAESTAKCRGRLSGGVVRGTRHEFFVHLFLYGQSTS